MLNKILTLSSSWSIIELIIKYEMLSATYVYILLSNELMRQLHYNDHDLRNIRKKISAMLLTRNLKKLDIVLILVDLDPVYFISSLQRS